MRSSSITIRNTSLLVGLALLCAASITGCTRSTALPPLVDEQGAPQIPGKFVWHNLVTGDGEAARQFYGGLFGWEFDVKKDGRYSVITYQGATSAASSTPARMETRPSGGIG